MFPHPIALWHGLKGAVAWDDALVFTESAELAVTLDAPTLALAELSETSIRVSITDNSDGEEGFEVERKLASEADTEYAVVHDTAAAGTQDWDDTGLTDGLEYQYRARAYEGATRLYSPYSNAPTELLSLLAATDLQATTISSSRIDLAWTDNSGGNTGYDIYFATGATPPGTEPEYSFLDSVGDVATYSATGLDPETTYHFIVYATRGAESSDASNNASATTDAATPDKVTGLDATAASSTQIDLDWSATGDTTGYEYRYALAGTGMWTQVDTESTATSVTVGDLDPNTEYDFQVRAYNAVGPGDWSDTASEFTLSRLPAPGNFNPTAEDVDRIDATWDAVTNASGYEWSNNGGSSWTDLGNVLSHSDTTLSPDTTYDVRVRAYRTVYGVDNPGDAAVDSVTTLNLTAPTGVTATRSFSSPFSAIDVSWTDASNGEDEFGVYRSPDDTTYTLVDTVPSGTTAYEDTGLVDATRYYYKVQARRTNARGTYTGTLSSQDNDTTDILAPTNLAASLNTYNSIQLTWTDNSQGNDGYDVLRATGATAPSDDGDYTVVAQIGDANSYLDEGLAEDTDYHYRVRATASATSQVSETSNTASQETDNNDPEVTSASIADTSGSGTYQAQATFSVDSDTESVRIAYAEYDASHTPVSSGTHQDLNVAPGATGVTSNHYETDAEHYVEFTITPYSGNNQTGFVGDAVDTGEVQITDRDPAAPGNFSAAAADVDAVDLSWDAVPGADSYRWRRDGFAWNDAGTNTSVTDTDDGAGLDPGTSYSYDVQAIEDGFNGDLSSDSATTLNLDPPTSVSAARNAGSPYSRIDVSWLDASNGEDSYVVERSLDGSTGWTEATDISNTFQEYADTGLDDSTRYYYRIRAEKTTARGTYTGDPSSTANATTDILAPTNLTAELSGTSDVQLEWTDNSVGNDQYEIMRATGATPPADDGSYTVIATVGGADNSYLDTTTSTNTDYHYRVRAKNTELGQTSATSNTASQETGDGTPEVTATTISDTSGGGTYSAGGTYDVDLDTESVKIEYAEYDEDHLVLSTGIHANVNVTPGSNGNNIPDYTSDQCHYVEFTITPYTLNNQSGTSGSSVDTGEVRVGDDGSCPP